MYESIITKLNAQNREEPIVAFVDFDGTLYPGSRSLWKAPIYNRRTAKMLQANNIPLIVVTGRADWTPVCEREMRFFGFSEDAVAAGAGSVIYARVENTLIKDTSWEEQMQGNHITWKDQSGVVHAQKWDDKQIIEIANSLPIMHYMTLKKDQNSFAVRFTVNNLPINILENSKHALKETFPEGVKILIAEKLFVKNTRDIYSGDVLIVPFASGKHNAIKYFLETFSKATGKKMHGYIFGDSSIDIKMLLMPEDQTHYALDQYGVNLTPRAYHILTHVYHEHPTLHITREHGPKVLYQTMRNLHPTFSKAQNSSARRFIKPFEKIANKTIYPTLTPNEISLKGLELTIKGIDRIYESKNKLRGFQEYTLGNSLDLIDGIRARHSTMATQDGQLVDGFCDRVKEFYQLYRRGQKKLPSASAYQSFLTALSCVLPAIARAQVEIHDITVAEVDPHGGSMLMRTKRLFTSLLFDVVGQHKRSEKIDRTIYEANIATYHNRISHLKSNPRINLSFLQQITKASLSSFQQKALERFLMYVRILQEEDEIVRNIFAKYSELEEQYMKDRQLFGEYLGLDIMKLRQQFGYKEYELSIKKYIQL